MKLYLVKRTPEDLGEPLQLRGEIVFSNREPLLFVVDRERCEWTVCRPIDGSMMYVVEQVFDDPEKFFDFCDQIKVRDHECYVFYYSHDIGFC